MSLYKKLLQLYTGYPIRTTTLRPLFEQSKKLVTYNERESNRFLYASIYENEACLQGAISVLEKYMEIVDYRITDTFIPTIFIKTSTDQVLRREMLLMEVFYLYRIEKKGRDEWVQVPKSLGRYSLFYKTNRTISSSIMEIKEIYILDWLENKNISIETPRMTRCLY